MTDSPASNSSSAPERRASEGRSFLEERIETDLEANLNQGRVVTRFPPEPNGYLHIGHAKSICLNFGLAKKYGGRCHLRFDDTNPEKESEEFTAAIKRDVTWLGFDWGEHLYFTSNNFEALYGYALDLIDRGLAYVDDQSAEDMRQNRGTLTTPGTPSAARSRTPEENRKRFEGMRAGEFGDGSCVLRAKIDLASPNFTMRDPTLYRVRRQHHHNTGDAWCIYPMYDFAHGLSDAIEGITHSICTLEFVNNRELYDWLLDKLEIETRLPSRPRQIEFNKLKLNFTVMSKRLLRQLVEEGHVSGWDDPRMLTLSGLRRRGVPASAIIELCTRAGVSKKDAWIDLGVLEGTTRDALEASPRRMAVLDPVKLVIETYPEGKEEEFHLDNHPKNPSMGTRPVPFSRVVYIEREDFAAEPPTGSLKKFFRLALGIEVRLRGAYLVTCTSVIKDDAGIISEIRCTHDPDSRGGDTPDGRKVKGTLHWVAAKSAVTAPVRLFDRLFRAEHPGAATADAPDVERRFLDDLNPTSLRQAENAKLEPSLAEALAGDTFQFERTGYFCADSVESVAGTPVFNRVVTLRDSWAPKPVDARAQQREAKRLAREKQREASLKQKEAKRDG